jgi:hypothetical protein
VHPRDDFELRRQISQIGCPHGSVFMLRQVQTVAHSRFAFNLRIAQVLICARPRNQIKPLETRCFRGLFAVLMLAQKSPVEPAGHRYILRPALLNPRSPSAFVENQGLCLNELNYRAKVFKVLAWRIRDLHTRFGQGCPPHRTSARQARRDRALARAGQRLS